MISRPRKPAPSTVSSVAASLQPPCTSAAAPLQPVLSEGPAPGGREVARRRLDAVAQSEAARRSGASQTEADARAAAVAGVSAGTLRRWRLACRDLSPEARLAALADRPGRGRCGALSNKTMRDCVEALVYHHGPHLTASHVQRVLEVRYPEPPGLRAVQRWLKAWRADSSNARALSAVSDPDGHRSRRAPALGNRAVGVDAPNALWELDSTPADVMCLDGRHQIVGAIDVWSRRVKLLVVPVSRTTAICALLRRCLIDWGVPSLVRTDEGRDYTSAHLARVLADLGVTHDVCPPYTPDAKPYIERMLGTLTRDLFAFLPGFTGHNVADRKKLEARRSMAQRRGADAQETFGVDLTSAQLQERCDVWCEDVYGRRVHSGIGQSPYLRMSSWTASLKRLADPRALDPLLAEPVSNSGDGPRRTIGKKGVQVDGIHYIAPEMGERIGERVEVRYDPADRGRLFIFAASGAFLFLAEDPHRTGCDVTAMAVSAKARASRADCAARDTARALKRTHAPERAMSDVLDAGHHDAGKVVALPRPSSPHETPALRAASRAAVSAGNSPADGVAPARGRAAVMAAMKKIHLKEDGE